MTNHDNLPATVTQSNSLADLAARIRTEHEACQSALQRGLEHALAAGKLLREAKDQVPHGQWLLWLREHVRIPERTAQRYMAVAPYAADIKSDKLADLTGDVLDALTPPPRPPDQAESWEEMAAWAQQQLDGPFTDQDTDFDSLDYFSTKLMHQAGVPAITSIMLSFVSEMDDRSILRLCPYDELIEACKALAPVFTGKSALKIDCANMVGMQRGIVFVKMEAGRMCGALLIEIEHRCHIDDETYEAEWEEAHAKYMAAVEKKLSELVAAP